MGGEVGARILNRGKHDDYSKAKGTSWNAAGAELMKRLWALEYELAKYRCRIPVLGRTVRIFCSG